MSESESGDGLPPAIEPALRAIAMPADANPNGDIFGGWILSQMDLAGGRVATVAITGMVFRRPVFVGDEVTCYTQPVKVGRTSLTFKVESWARRGDGGAYIKVTEGFFTYVAVSPERRPRPLPPDTPA